MDVNTVLRRLEREGGRNQSEPARTQRDWRRTHAFLSRNSARLAYRLCIVAKSQTIGNPTKVNVETTERRFCREFAARQKKSG